MAFSTAPYRRAFKLYTWKPLKDMRAANGDRKLLIPLVKEWKVDKYAELQSVQVAASFCGGAVLASLPWSRSNDATWFADALLFSSLICSIFAIITSIQTKSMLDDLPSCEQLDGSLPEIEVLRMRRTILRYKHTPGIKHSIMLFIWQFPSMTMAYAWCTFIAGLTVYVCSPFIQKLPWQDRHRIAVAYLAFGVVGLITYIFTTVFVFVGEKDYERSVANSRASTIKSNSASTINKRIVNTNDVETGLASSDAGNHTQEKGDTISAVAEGADPIQAARARFVVGFEQSGIPRRNIEKSRRPLLY
ncbi:hypothetical protein CC86DRAFT_384682 [Ophiobolus disseminans]|uniref:Uncharacterized protein n=1 Tax=Ophiobolus disseminans TaxID=1469910 RepID=A0A6A6ZS73_9PLEO|nr:hypothetical protein CC86DRAFT_384682 [Ophiobolus disseminans]